MSTWWIDEPFLLGGGNPSEAELQDLYEKSFRIIISLLDDIKQPPKYNTERATALGYTRSSIAIPDFQPSSLDHGGSVLDREGSVGCRRDSQGSASESSRCGNTWTGTHT